MGSSICSRVLFYFLILALLAPASIFAFNSKTKFESALRVKGIIDEQIAKILKKTDYIPTARKTKDIIDWLKAQGVEDVGKILVDYPSVLRLSINRNLKPKIDWLKEQGVTDIGKVLSMYPRILGMSVDDNLQPTALWFKGKGVKDIGKLLSTFPAMLALSISDNLDPKLDHFEKEWGISIEQIETMKPLLLGASLARISALASGVKLLGSDVKALPLKKRMTIAASISIEDVLENLWQKKIILARVKAVSQLSAADLVRIKDGTRLEGFLSFLRSSKGSKRCEAELAPAKAPPEPESDQATLSSVTTGTASLNLLAA